jgi:hypothetical protein
MTMTVAVLRPQPASVGRALFAGAIWGLTMSVGLPILGFLGCGVICLSDIANTAVIAVPAGLLTITPVVIFATRAGAPARESR